MSEVSHATTDDKPGQALASDVPAGQVDDDSYANCGNESVPVQKDSDPVHDPVRPEHADSDAQLAQDEKDAVDESNLLKGRTRGAKPAGTYKEPDDVDLRQ